jgi:hypothetical protein
VLENERPRIMADDHEGIAGGHYASKATAQKVLHVGLWWPIFIEMKRNTFKNAMFVRGLENQTDGMRCPYTHK